MYEDTFAPKTEAEEGAVSLVMTRRKIKKGFNWGCAAIILVNILVAAVMFVYSAVGSLMLRDKVMADMGIEVMTEENAADVVAEITTRLNSGDGIIYMNAILMTLAEIITFAILMGAVKPFKFSALFGKQKLNSGSIALLALCCIGVQGISMLIQVIITALTGMTGVSEGTSNALSFGSTPLSAIVMVAYGVIVGPILEELIYRGFIQNTLGAVNKTFGLVAASLLFGLMHANFNQIFNGFLLGLIFGYAAMKSGSLKTSIILHIISNAHAFGLQFIMDKTGESSETIIIAYMAVLAVLGIALIAVNLKKHGKITNEDVITPEFSFDLPEDERKRFGWKDLFKTATFWISAFLCIFTAVSQIRSVAPEDAADTADSDTAIVQEADETEAPAESEAEAA